jgi:hypothetical protein
MPGLAKVKIAVQTYCKNLGTEVSCRPSLLSYSGYDRLVAGHMRKFREYSLFVSLEHWVHLRCSDAQKLMDESLRTVFHSKHNMARASLAIATAILTLLMVGSLLAQMQDFVNRREGTTVHPDALEDFTVIALHRTFAQFSRDAELNVRFFLPKLPGDHNSEVFVEAVELQDSVHYLMQSKSISWTEGNWNVFGHWPTKDVIDRLGIDSQNLGVLARYRMSGGPPVYLPVDVYQNDRPVTKHAYTVHFITGQDLQALDVSVTKQNGVPVSQMKQHLACSRTFNPNCKLFAAGSTQVVDLDMSSVPEGEYFVKLTGHVPGSSTPTSLDIVLYHHP